MIGPGTREGCLRCAIHGRGECVYDALLGVQVRAAVRLASWQLNEHTGRVTV